MLKNDFTEIPCSYIEYFNDVISFTQLFFYVLYER